MTDDGSDAADNKVDRVIAKRNLGDLGAELERRWLAESEESMSTRELADYFNRRVLEAAVDDSDVFTLSGDVDQVYETLTGEGDEALVRSRLEESGVDVDGVEDDFVSHQTVHRYLKEHREVEQPEPSDEDRVQRGLDTVQRLRGRTAAVTERTVGSLQNNDSIDVGSFDVLVDVQVLCHDCGRSYDAAELLERGGCDCE